MPMSASDAARHLGCNRSTVSRAAKRLGVGTPLGTIILLTDAEVSRISKVIQEKAGNPNFVPGNHFGKPPKKTSRKKKK